MKKTILLLLISLTLVNTYSQEKDKFRVGLDFGFVPTSGGGGAMFSIEPKFNLADNMNIGLRYGAAGIAKDIKTNDVNQSVSAKISANGSLVGTFDYYFHKSSSSFAPYVGAGIGYYSLANVELDNNNNTSQNYTPATTGKMGGLIRAGFEWGKFRMGVEYNLISDSDLNDFDGNVVGTATNSYAGIHLGFYLGGGKWDK